MRVYICVDLEGVGGVTGEGGVGLKAGTPQYQIAVRNALREVNACVGAAFEAGASAAIVCDSHGGGRNLPPEELDQRAELYRSDRVGKLPGRLDEGWEAMVLLGYHAMSGTPDAILSHSFSSRAIFRMVLDGHELGEIGYDARQAGECGVPVALVVPDAAGWREARAEVAGVGTVVTKTGTGWNAADLVPEDEVVARIREAVPRALGRAGEIAPLVPDLPVELRVTYQRVPHAERIAREHGLERVDGCTTVQLVESLRDARF
ncbi:MAG: M55 family metallopeptidase [Planctomycetota bacterium]